MSRWNEKTKSIRAQAAAVRRNYNPSPDSLHLRMYHYWQSKSGDDRQRENFCHYWRCVMIWAPLYWARTKLLAILALSAIAMILTGLAGLVGPVFLFIGTVLYLTMGMTAFCVIMSSLPPLDDSSLRKYLHDKYFHNESYSIRVFVWAVLPVVVAVVIGIGIVVGLPAMAVIGLQRVFRARVGRSKLLRSILRRSSDAIQSASRKFWHGLRQVGRAIWSAIKWSFTARPGYSVWVSWIRPILVLPIVLAILAPQHLWATVLWPILSGALLAGLIILCITWVADIVHQRREAQRTELYEHELKRNEAILDRFFRNLFTLKHPGPVDEAMYTAWRDSYCRRIDLPDSKDLVGIGYIAYFDLFDRSLEDMNQYEAMYGPLPVLMRLGDQSDSSVAKKTRRRSAGIIEFLSFSWSIIVVNKWKICPIVEVPRD